MAMQDVEIREQRKSSRHAMTAKMFVVHLSKLEDEQLHTGNSYTKTLTELLSRSLYFMLNVKGRAVFEAIVRHANPVLSRRIEGLMSLRMDSSQQSCMEDLCPAVTAVHAIRERFKEMPKNEDTILAAGEDMRESELSGKVEVVCRRLQFDAQKLLWNMFLGNQAFLKERDNVAWQALDYSDKVVTLIIWINVLDLLFGDSRSESSAYLCSNDAFTEYASTGDFRGKWLVFKRADQERAGVLTWRLNVKVLRALMGQGHSLDTAVLKSLQEFSRQLKDIPFKVEHFAFVYYGKFYADMIEDLKEKDKENLDIINALNRSSMPPRSVLAAGIYWGGFLLHQLNYIPGASEIYVDKERHAGEWQSLARCSANNLKVLAMVRNYAREHHKHQRLQLVSRVQEELGKSRVEALKDVAALLWYVREGAPMLIHRAFSSLVPMMLTLDRYQSGHEANSFDPSRSVPRPEWEAKISGGLYVAGNLTMDEKMERPKYGALNVVQDVLGINGGVFYGATYITLKNVRRLATVSFTDTASDAIQGVTGDDCISSALDGSDCDLGTLDYAAGVICDGWSTSFLQVAIKMANMHLRAHSGEVSPVRSRRDLNELYDDFMDLPSFNCLRQYDEVQIHGQVHFAENVESMGICKPFVPDKMRGKKVESNGKLIIINPEPHFYNNYNSTPLDRKSTLGESHEQEFQNDDYYLYYQRLALCDDFEGATPAFDEQVKSWSEDKRAQFRAYINDQQVKLVSLGALVRLDIPEYGSRYCFHLKACLERLAEKFPSIDIRRIIVNPKTGKLVFEVD